MFEIYRVTGQEMMVIDRKEKNCWINLSQPSEEELARLGKIIKLPGELICWLKDIDELPKLVAYPEFLFILVGTPYNTPKSDNLWITHPLGIILHDEFVITICFDKNDIIDIIKNTPFKYSKSRFTLEVLKCNSITYQRYLKDIHKKMIECEEQLSSSHKNTVIMDFLDLEKSLVYFDTALRENHFLYIELLKERRILKHKENRTTIRVIIQESEESTQIVEIYSNILSNTLDAFASIISNNLNLTMKTLTALTLLISIPTLIASIYGMNVELPFSHTRYSFTIIMVGSIFMSIIAIYLFAKKKYF